MPKLIHLNLLLLHYFYHHHFLLEYQDNFLMFYFDDGLMMHEIKHRTISDMIDMFPATLRDIIKDYEKKDGKLGMMINSNIPSSWATFPMSDQRFIRPQKF